MTTEGMRAAAERVMADREFARRVYDAPDSASPIGFDLDPAEFQALQRAVTADVDAARGEVSGYSFSWGTLDIGFVNVGEIARDPASGLPTGKRMHKPFVITKELDQSSPG